MDKNQLKAMLTEVFNELFEERIKEKNDVKEEKKVKYRRRRAKEKETQQKQRPNRKNTFDEKSLSLTEDERRELEKASKDDKKNRKKRPSSNFMAKRPEFKKVEVRCRVCGKLDKVHPGYVVKDEDGYRYKCNRCSCSAG